MHLNESRFSSQSGSWFSISVTEISMRLEPDWENDQLLVTNKHCGKFHLHPEPLFLAVRIVCLLGQVECNCKCSICVVSIEPEIKKKSIMWSSFWRRQIAAFLSAKRILKGMEDCGKL